MSEAAPLGPPGPGESYGPGYLERIVDRLPIDESSLFRNVQLWSWLEAQVLAPLVERATSGGKPIEILSLGCADGQEVFSLALMLLGLFRARGLMSSSTQRLARIRGLDASASRIETARSGVVSAWSVERAPRPWVEGAVFPVPGRPGEFRVDPAALALCQFEQGNLLELAAAGPIPRCDLVLCQHVLIYFRPDAAMAFLSSLVKALAPGTVLVVSPVEAHLIEAGPAISPLDWVGAVRVGAGARPAAPPSVPRRPAAPAYRQVVVPSPGPTPVDRYLAEANRQLASGHPGSALNAARAACFAEPEHLMARFVLGQVLMSIDPPQGRRVLHELLEALGAHEAGAALLSAPELTIAQLAQAARLLIATPGGAR